MFITVMGIDIKALQGFAHCRAYENGFILWGN